MSKRFIDPKDKKTLEFRSVISEVRADPNGEDGAIIVGRPVVYNSRTDLGFFDEVIEPGALNRTDLNDVRLLINHDLSRVPLARSRRNNANSTMQLFPDDLGLDMRARLDIENNADARALYSAISRGDITGMSFMFSVGGDAWEDLDTEHPFRRITDIASIVEVSVVNFPAYSEAQVFARNSEALESARIALESARARRDAEPPEGGINSENPDTLALEKEKIKILGGKFNK